MLDDETVVERNNTINLFVACQGHTQWNSLRNLESDSNTWQR